MRSAASWRCSRLAAGAGASRAVALAWLASSLGWLGACRDEAAEDDGPAVSGTATQASGSEGSGTASEGSDTASDDDTADDTATVPPECTAVETLCGAVCSDLQTDPTNCGQCGRSCVIPQAMAACVAGECAMAACEPGWSDCDAMVVTGCETPIDCQAGTVCTTTCGSEGAVDCTNACAGAGGMPVCTPPIEACNVIDDDCDGTCDQGPLPACRVSVHRSNSPTLGHFYTTDLAEATSGDLSLEAQDYFWLYADVEGLQPLFRCIKANGKRWMTTSTDCEGTAAPELTMGFISPDARCGSTPLYRLRNPGPDAHFYTTSAGERDNAVAAYGFIDEGLAGYVWLGP